ncbi:hypothetical protein AtubIFM57143_007878 [Aspergillus tubingensis]|uniref:Serine hydrolase domain-containing protein n=2 Tax=Aspergillus subgen. Circumdati TaxID=2720871 RepID=A0A100IJ74_ASPNG|nr:hypothetical protein CH063_07263 [Aspergillus niger]GLA92357.1 hypothetical protein AtubIFM57143_007878 [Aspergillus tubingensis]
MGANAQVLEIQIAAITSSFPEHEFVFAEGLEPCLPDPKVQSFLSGPYLCYYSCPTPTQMHEAFTLIREVMDEDGPFEGVIGFSQGAALAASMILQHQKDNPTAMPLFDLAIFLGASLPFDMDSSLALRSIVAMHHRPNGYPDGAGDDPLILQQYDPRTTNLRIEIPTLHVIGRTDPFRQQGELLVELSSGDAIPVVHDAGHIVPRDMGSTAKIVRLVEGMIGRAQHIC